MTTVPTVPVRPSSAVYHDMTYATGQAVDVPLGHVTTGGGLQLTDDSDATYTTGRASDDGGTNRTTLACVDFDPMPGFVWTPEPSNPTISYYAMTIRVAQPQYESWHDNFAAHFGMFQKGTGVQLDAGGNLMDWDAYPTEGEATFPFRFTTYPSAYHIPVEDRFSHIDHPDAADIIRSEGFVWAFMVYPPQQFSEYGDLDLLHLYELTIHLAVAGSQPIQRLHPRHDTGRIALGNEVAGQASGRIGMNVYF